MSIVERENVPDRHKDMKPVEIYRAIAEKAKKLRALDLMTGYNFATTLVGDQAGSFYHIILLDMTDKTVSISAFPKSRLDDASAIYAEIELATRGDATKDVVMVSAGELKTLEKAYPNYFLDIDAFTLRLKTIIDIVEGKE